MITEPKKILFILISLFFARFTYGIAIGVPAKFEHFPNDSFPQILWNNGFWHSRIDSTRGDTIFITLGKPAIAESIAVRISDSLEQIVMPKLIYRVGDTIRKSKIEKQQEIFVDALENNGYPFASCTTSVSIVSADSEKIGVSLLFSIDEGEKVILQRLEAQIDGKTKGSVIRHYMLFRSGQLYRRNDIEKATSRLRKMRIVSVSSEPYPAMDSQGKWTLVVRAKDIPTTTVSGLLGYADDEISGDIEFSTRNFYGTGRIINFTLSAYEKNREIEIGYREPFLWNSNISPQISSKWTIKDSTYTKREHKLGVFIPLGYETDLYTGFITDRTVPGSANNSISDGESFGLEFSARYSTLDDAILPTEGIYLNGGATGQYIHYWGDENTIDFGSQGEGKVLTAFRWKLFSLWIEISGWGWLVPILPQQSQWEYLGGWKNLRGYREDQFIGSKIFWGTIEPRFIPISGVHIFPFADVGGYRDYEKWHTKFGYGGGIEYRYGAGVFSIEYGIGEGRNFKNGLVHFGLRMNI